MLTPAVLVYEKKKGRARPFNARAFFKTHIPLAPTNLWLVGEGGAKKGSTRGSFLGEKQRPGEGGFISNTI